MRKLKAQQITEFLLAVPLLVIFFVILTEFSFGLNSYLVLNNSVKAGVVGYLNALNIDSSTSSLETIVRNSVAQSFADNNIPDTSTLETRLIKVSEYPVIISSYEYKPGFNYQFLPALKTIKMNASAVIPIKEPIFTGYENGISSDDLDLIRITSEGEE